MNILVLQNENTNDCSLICDVTPPALHEEDRDQVDSLQLAFEQSEVSPPSKVRSPSGSLNVERNLKLILRQLRKSLKRMFNDVFNKKHYYWNDSSLRKQTLKFFTELSSF